MLIAISGTIGSGKGTVAQYLARKHDFIYLSVRNFYAGEVVKRGLAVNRANITTVAQELKAQNGPLYALEQLLSRTVRTRKMVIESVRTVPEAKYLKLHGDALWVVDAEVETRYKRIKERAGETDNISFEEFKRQSDADLHSADPNGPNLTALKEMASRIILVAF